jgi:hypothetical protein
MEISRIPQECQSGTAKFHGSICWLSAHINAAFNPVRAAKFRLQGPFPCAEKRCAAQAEYNRLAAQA